MPKVLRSPPKIDSQLTASDSEIHNIDKDSQPQTFVAQRTKRRRQSPESPPISDEFKSMFMNWKDSQTEMLSKLSVDVAEIKIQNTKICATNAEIEKSLEFIYAQFADLQKKVSKLETENKETLLKVTSLENKVEEMERIIKSSTIEIRNVPVKNSKIDKNQLSNIVINTCKALDVPIDQKDINDVFLVKGKAENITIVTEFTKKVIKSEVIKSAKSYNRRNPNNRLNSTSIGLDNLSKPIYISEALTAKAKKLYFMARDTAKAAGYKFCWTNNSKIYLRKTEDSQYIEIKTESQLADLKYSK